MRFKRRFLRVVHPSLRLRSLAAVGLMLAAVEARAVSPLVVDDAGTVDARQLQLNAGWRLLRTPPVDLNAAIVNPVFGVAARGEVGATAGYEWRSGSVLAGEEAADGVSDLLVSTKWRFFEEKDGLQFGVRLDLKLPAASARKGLGSGDTDLGGVLIATRCWGAVCLDWNAGYVAANVSGGAANDDTWFFGQAVRTDLGGPWNLLAEAYGFVPAGPAAPPSEVRFNGGPQFTVRENFLVWAEVGSASGRGSADLTGYVGATWVF